MFVFLKTSLSNDALGSPLCKGSLHNSEVASSEYVQAESDLTFMGLAVFQTPLKEGSEPALKMLKESSHQLVMITGDAALTACFTAAKVHIVDRPVLILACSEAGATTTGVFISNSHLSSRSIAKVSSHSENHSFHYSKRVFVGSTYHTSFRISIHWSHSSTDFFSVHGFVKSP